MKETYLNFNQSKKANAVLDTAMVIVVITIFGIFSILSWNVWQDISPDVRESVGDMPEANESLNIIDERYPSLFDGLFLFIFVGLWITTLVASFMIDAHPIFFFVSLILLIVVLAGTVYIGNFYEEIITSDTLGDSYSDFPAMHHILSNLLIYAVVIGFSIMLVLYGKTRV